MIREALMDDNKTAVEFTPEAVTAYLDQAIRFWRKRRDEQVDKTHITAIHATCYVDAYQSVRMSLFGRLLPTEPKVQDSSR